MALGKTTEAWDTTLIDAQFGFAPGTSFSAAAKKTFDKALDARRRRGRGAVKERFAARGITF